MRIKVHIVENLMPMDYHDSYEIWYSEQMPDTHQSNSNTDD